MEQKPPILKTPKLVGSKAEPWNQLMAIGEKGLKKSVGS